MLNISEFGHNEWYKIPNEFNNIIHQVINSKP